MITYYQYIFTLAAAMIWTSAWKFIALWHAGRNKQKAWFIWMCVINTMGLLPIAYLLWGQKDRNEK